MDKVNLEKFKEAITKYDNAGLKALLFNFALQRIISECVLVDMFNSCRENGELIPKAETLESYSNSLETERILINQLGRTEAAKIYGLLEGITSNVKTVDYILQNDSVQYYRNLISTIGRK